MNLKHDGIVPIDWLPASDPPLHGEIVFVDGGLAQYRDGVWYSGSDDPPLVRPIQWEVKHWARISVPVRGEVCESEPGSLRSELEGTDRLRRQFDGMRAAIAKARGTTEMNDTAIGLYQKFRVERTDGSSAPGGKHSDCRYFVLDLNHDRFSQAALAAYADACRVEFPALAADIEAMVGCDVERQFQENVERGRAGFWPKRTDGAEP